MASQDFTIRPFDSFQIAHEVPDSEEETNRRMHLVLSALDVSPSRMYTNNNNNNNNNDDIKNKNKNSKQRRMKLGIREEPETNQKRDFAAISFCAKTRILKIFRTSVSPFSGFFRPTISNSQMGILCCLACETK